MLGDDAITPVQGDKLAIKGRRPSKHADTLETSQSCSCKLKDVGPGFVILAGVLWPFPAIPRIPRSGLGTATSPWLSGAPGAPVAPVHAEHAPSDDRSRRQDLGDDGPWHAGLPDNAGVRRPADTRKRASGCAQDRQERQVHCVRPTCNTAFGVPKEAECESRSTYARRPPPMNGRGRVSEHSQHRPRTF